MRLDMTPRSGSLGGAEFCLSPGGEASVSAPTVAARRLLAPLR
jgi:hypothetical protein